MKSLRAILLAVCLAAPCAAQAHPARVAVVLDQPSLRFQPMLDQFVREIRSFFRPGEVEVLTPVAGDGTVASVRTVLDRALNDSTVSVVIALGSTGSHLLARSGTLARPGIAANIIDAGWQNLAVKNGTSGVRNLTFVDQSYPIGKTLADFRKLVPYRKLAVILDRDQLTGVSGLEAGAIGLVQSAGAEAVIVPAAADPAAILSAIPSDADAVFLTPLGRLSDDGLRALLAGVAARRLPTLSYLADPDLKAGALASYEPAESWQRRARRVAVDLQRILAGEDAGTLPVSLVSAPRLTLNLTVARRIGFSPSRSLLTDAELIGADSAGSADTLTLGDVMRGAVARSLDLEAAGLEVASGAQNVKKVRSNLLPQIDSKISQTYTKAATAAASFGQQPERLLETGITMSLPIYSEEAWAGYGSEKKLQQARKARQDQVRLDVVLDAATAYLNVLRAGTVTDVRRSNLYRTRSNLEVATLREGVGSASRADIYRWQGEVATARRDLIAAEADVRLATLELNRTLHRPLDRAVAQNAVALDDPALLMRDSTILAWLDEPARLAELTRFLTSEAARLSPELAQSDAGISAQKRQLTAAGRAFWLPTVSLQGGFSNVLSRGGAGSSSPELPASLGFTPGPDATWQLRLQVSHPLFTGFARGANRAQAKLEVSRLEVERESVRQGIEQRIRAALESAAASYAAIALNRDASEAATRNYDLVSDAYSRGAASITSLIDAQSAALNAQETAANAVHDFLIDLLQVERAMGSFGALKTAEQQQAFTQRLRTLRTQP